jgi:hypothetical protein
MVPQRPRARNVSPGAVLPATALTLVAAALFTSAARVEQHASARACALPGEHALACSTHSPNDSAIAKIQSEVARELHAAPPYNFPAAYVKKALSSSADYRYADQNLAGVVAVTPGKDQGAHGYVLLLACCVLFLLFIATVQKRSQLGNRLT